MKKYFKYFTVVFLLVKVVTFSWAYTSTDFLSEEDIQKIEKEGLLKVKKNKKDTEILSLLPKSELSSHITSIWKNEEKPLLVQENLYLIHKKDLNREDPKAITISSASKVIRSISKMKGMKYYSNSDKKYEILYKDAFRIPEPKSKERIADDLTGSADGKKVYCILDDNSLGKIGYEVNYFQTEQELCATFESITDFNVGFVKAIPAGNLNMGFLIIDCGEDILVYSVIETRFGLIGLLEKRINESLDARMEAILNWFKEQF